MEDINRYPCQTPYESSPVCGTDGVTYGNIWFLKCTQIEEYGKRVNLQLKHKMACWIWEEYGFETYTVLFVSQL